MPRRASKRTRPPTTILPESGFSSPAMERRVVVFPQPEGPKSVYSCACFTSTLTWSTATTRGFERPMPVPSNVLTMSVMVSICSGSSSVQPPAHLAQVLSPGEPLHGTDQPLRLFQTENGLQQVTSLGHYILHAHRVFMRAWDSRHETLEHRAVMGFHFYVRAVALHGPVSHHGHTTRVHPGTPRIEPAIVMGRSKREGAVLQGGLKQVVDVEVAHGAVVHGAPPLRRDSDQDTADRIGPKPLHPENREQTVQRGLDG